jgi:hypothetical protein
MTIKKMRDKKKPIRVWVELEKPLDEADGNRIAELSNNMLQRLFAPNIPASYFTWNQHRGRYDFGSSMGRYSLADWGEWFDLVYLGRPQEK